jgi:carbon-monoxide dehydrogenase large subunit
MTASVAIPSRPTIPKIIGRSRPGVHNRRLVTGNGEYVGDIHLEDMHHLAVVRSTHPHAHILGIDATAALGAEGVVAVITGDEIARNTHPIPEGWDTGEAGAKRVDWYALALDRVRYVGEAVAAVVADSAFAAQSARDLVKVHYETLPHVTSADEALVPDGPLVEPDWGDNILVADGFSSGDVDAGLEVAFGSVRGKASSQRITGVPIEPRGIVADYDATLDFLTFWESTQQPHPVRTFLAEALGVSESTLRVIQPDVGGAFGLKQPTSQEEVLVAYAARRLKRPVRWMEDRSESLSVGGHSRETTCTYEAGFDSEGNITALRVSIVADVGAPTAYLGWGMSFVTMYSLPTVYRIPNVDVQLQSVVTNKCPWTPYRGFGKDVASWVMDRVVEHVARNLGMSGLEVRRRNLIGSDEFPYAQVSGAVFDSGDYHGVLDRLLEMVDYAGFPEIQRRAREEGRYLGIGIGQELTPEGVAMPGSIMNNGYDGATVRVMPTGDVQVLTGVTSPGSGNETALGQIAAATLGCNPERVSVVQGDSELCPWGLGNYSSRSIMIGGSAVVAACEELRDRLHVVAASMLGTQPDRLEWGDNRIWFADGDDRLYELGFDDAVERIYWHAFEEHADLVEPGLEATRYFRIPNIFHQPERDGRFSVYPTWPNGVAACIVEVDPDTGSLKILRHCLVEDSGTIINPLLAEANLHGAIAQGIGGTVYEEVVYDDSGQLLTGTLMDYTIPTAVELPRFEILHHETPSPFTRLGAKGVGESGLGSILGALCSAVENAFADLDLWFDQLPLTPARVWHAIDDAKRRQGARVDIDR